MEDDVLKAMARWPDVPDVYGWLSLDRRGTWRLRGTPVRHAASLAFIKSNYGVDQRGCWFFQNGPQRVFVQLEYTPWVYHPDQQGNLLTHTQQLAHPSQVMLDEHANLLLVTQWGLGVVDDRHLDTLLNYLHTGTGQPLDLDHLEALENPQQHQLTFYWSKKRLPVGMVASDSLPKRFNFVSWPTKTVK